VRPHPEFEAGGSFTTETTTWGATTNAVLALREHLIAARVSLVVIEATSDYWKPFVRHEALGIERG
jgi:hypothetical protein